MRTELRVSPLDPVYVGFVDWAEPTMTTDPTVNPLVAVRGSESAVIANSPIGPTPIDIGWSYYTQGSAEAEA